jgi:hypothetical protein
VLHVQTRSWQRDHDHLGGDGEPGYTRNRHRAVQLPHVVDQLVQPVRPDQPAQHERSADDSVVARGHRDA